MNFCDFKSIHCVGLWKALLFSPAHMTSSQYIAYKTKDSLEDGFYEHLFMKTIKITGLLCQKKNLLRCSRSNICPLVALELFVSFYLNLLILSHNSKAEKQFPIFKCQCEELSYMLPVWE